jgi:hypothetical protein
MLSEKASSNEGHGFSRSHTATHLTALAAEVRFSRTYRAKSFLGLRRQDTHSSRDSAREPVDQSGDTIPITANSTDRLRPGSSQRRKRL